MPITRQARTRLFARDLRQVDPGAITIVGRERRSNGGASGRTGRGLAAAGRQFETAAAKIETSRSPLGALVLQDARQERVEDEAALFLAVDQTGLVQHVHVMRHVDRGGLQHAGDLADVARAIAEKLHDAQALRRCQGGEFAGTAFRLERFEFHESICQEKCCTERTSRSPTFILVGDHSVAIPRLARPLAVCAREEV